MRRKIKIPKTKLECAFCIKKYRSNFVYRLHLHTHESSKNSWFQCQTCKRKFSKIVRLLKHRVIHPPPKQKDERKLAISDKKTNVNAIHKQGEVAIGDVRALSSFSNQSPKVQLASVAEVPHIAALPPVHHGGHTLKKHYPCPQQRGEDHVFSRLGLGNASTESCNGSQESLDELSYKNEPQRSRLFYEKDGTWQKPAEGSSKHDATDLQVSVVSSSSLSLETLPSTLCNEESSLPLLGSREEQEVHGKTTDVIAENQLQCSICSKVLASAHSLTGHMSSHNDGVRYSCPTCDKSYAWKYSLTLHMRSSHCSTSSAEGEKVQGGNEAMEMLLNTDAKNYENANECHTDRMVDSLEGESSESRISRSKNEAKASCLLADERSGGFMYPCVDCSRPFRTEDQMWSHFETTHCTMGKAPVTSPSANGVADRSFSNATLAKDHQATDTGKKNFSCSFCRRQFVWRCSLYRHFRRTACGSKRKASKAKECAKNVKKSLSASDKEGGRKSIVDLTSQPRLENSDSQSMKRSKAGKGQRVVEANKHAVLAENFIRTTILFHEGYGVKEGMEEFLDIGDAPEIGKHSCKVCDKAYKYKSSLKIHLRSHTGEIPYQCSICKERFAAHRYCRKHVIKHGTESTDRELREAFQKLVGTEKECPIKENTKQHGHESDNGERSASQMKCSEELVVFNSHADEEGHSSPAPERGLPKREAKSKALAYVAMMEMSDDELSVSRKQRTRKKIVKDSLQLRKVGDSDVSSEEEKQLAKRRRMDGRASSSRSSLLPEKVDSDEEWTVSSLMDQEEDQSLLDDESDESFTGSRQAGQSTKVKAEKGLAKEKPQKADAKNSRLLFQCKVCDTKFASRFVLRRHEVITGHAKASYECPYCKRIYSEGGAYSNHMYVHQRENGMKCDICGKELQSRTTFLNHKEMHKKNPFTCKLCFEWFPSERKLEEHTNTSHDAQKEFKCKYCHKTFDWQSNYSRHLNKHTNKKEFKCKICHYSFNIISNLKRHMVSVHKGETEFGANTWEAVNPVHVDHVLNRQHQRRDLWKVEEDDEDEDLGNKRRGRLKALKAVNRKKYPCEACKFVCSSRMELTNHQRYGHKQENKPESALIHFIIEDENFVCQLCGSVIYIRHSLKNHMLRVHQLDVTEDDIAGVSKFGADVKVEGRTKAKGHGKSKPSKARADASNTSAADQSPIGSEVSSSSGGKRKSDVNTRKKAGPPVEAKSLKDKCSLCTAAFACKELLVEHLRDFHKIPAGFEEALIEITKDVNKVAPKVNQGSTKSVDLDKGGKEKNDCPTLARQNKESNTRACPICNQEFQSMALLERHASVCNHFSV